jgi:Tol biopolymer transport system component
MVKIFVSYSRKDEPFARQLAGALGDLGADVWIDHQAIHTGSRWNDAIQEGLDACDLMLLILSPDSMASKNVGDEWLYYLNRDKPIFPVWYKPCKIHFQLDRLQRIDFHSQSFDTALRQLHNELKRQGFRLNPLPASEPTTATTPQPIRPTIPRRNWLFPVLGLVALLAVLVIIGFLLLYNGDDGETDLTGITEEPTETTASPATEVAALSETEPPDHIGTFQAQVATADAVNTKTEASIRDTVEAITAQATTNDAQATHATAVTETPTPTEPLTLIGGGTGQIAFNSRRDGRIDIYLMGTDGSNPVNLTNNPPSDYLPAWSPDGQFIVFDSNGDGNREIYVMEADGSNPVNLTNNPADDFDPVWSPDGQFIAYASDRDGNNEIYVMEANGDMPINLSNNPAADYSAAWSPDSQFIAFTSNRDGDEEIYVMEADGSSNPINLTNNLQSDRLPDWSPDGQFIVFSSFRDGNYEIFVMEENGHSPFKLTNSPQGDTSPVWSPDGQFIAFVSDRDGNNEIYVMEASGSNPKRLTNAPGDDSYPAWQPTLRQ